MKLRIWILLFALGLVMNGAGEGLFGAPKQSAISILSSSDSQIKLQVLPGNYPQRLINLQGQSYLLFEGVAAASGDEGKPLLPTEGILLGIPATAEISLEVLSSSYEVATQQRVAPVPQQHLDEDMNAHQQFVLDAASYSRNVWYPSSTAELGEISYLRFQRVAKILVHPYQYNPATNELRKLTSLTLNVRFTYLNRSREALTFRPAGADPQFEEVYKSLLLNYDDAKKWRGSLTRSTIERPSSDPSRDWFDPAMSYLKLLIIQDGLYKLTFNDLTASGLNAGLINPQTFKLYNRGSQVPLYAAGESDGVFDPADYLEFYAQRNHGTTEFYDAYTDTNVYWLTWGGTPGLRMIAEGTDTAGTPAQLFNRTVHFEQDKQYYFGYNELEIIQPEKVPGEGWYWSDFFPGTTTDFGCTIQNVVLNAQVNATLRVRFNGMSQHFTTPDHTAKLSLNGASLGQVSFDFSSDTVFTVSFLSTVLKEGSNTLTVQSVPTQAAVNKFYLDWFEVSYQSTFKALSNELTFSSQPAGGGLPIRYTISNFQSSAIDVYNLTDGKKLLGGAVSSSPDGSFSIAFHDTGSVIKRYIVVAESQKLKPARTEVKQFKDIRSNSTGADYIVITHEVFKQSADRLATYRASQMNVRTAVIDVQDIYNEFNYGLFSPEAIKPFLRYAYNEWTRPAPAYVLLLGDACWDFKFNLPTTVKKNFIPAHGNPPTDNWFVAFDSVNSVVPFMIIGRIPAESVTEADDVVDKLVHYDQTPLGDWTKKFLFITGGNDDGEKASFNNQANFLISSYVVPAPVGGLPYRVYKQTDAIIDGENKQLIQDIISNGTVFLNFIGHSGGRIWGVDAGNPNDLRNTGGEFVFVTSVSCNVAAFADPQSNVLTEDFLFASHRAAIGCWAGSSLGYIDIGFVLTNSFLRSMARDSIRGMGKLTTLARIELWRNSPSSPRVLAGVGLHPLLGDPIAQIALPLKPDLAMTQGDFSLNPSIPTEVDSLVAIKTKIKNYGLVPRDSVAIRITDTFNGVTLPIGADAYRVPPVAVEDSLFVLWNVARKSGNHIIGVQVDPDNKISEVTKANNRLDVAVQVFSGKLLPLRPVLSSVVPRGPQVLEVINAASAAPGVLKYFFEVDTSSQFNSGAKIASPAVDGGILSTQWTSPPLSATGLYYWRSRIYDGRDSSAWTVSSFIVSATQPPPTVIRWSESSQKQFLAEQRFQTDATDSGVTIARSGGIPLYVRSVGERHDPYQEYYSVIKIGPQTITVFNFFYGPTFVVATVNELDGSFQYRPFTVASNPAMADSMSQFLRNISPDQFILITVAIDGYSNDNENLYSTLESLGARQIRSVRPGDAWSFLAQKRTGIALESYSQTAGAEISYVIPSFYNAQIGSITTGTIGPARHWRSGSWTNDASGPGTDITMRVLGVKSNSAVDTLFTLQKDLPSKDLTSIDPRTYPMLRLLAILRSDFGTATPVLKSWSVEYEGPPDPAIASQLLRANRDSVLEGETIDFSADVSNIGYTTADSVKVNFYVLEQASTRRLFKVSPVDDIEAGKSKTATASLNTTGLRGQQTLLVELDPAGLTELYTINNVARRPFYVRRDTVPPLLQVTFDGAPIIDRDYVSAQPNILIKLFDNSPLPIQDTANVSLRLDNLRVPFAGNPQLTYSFPSSGNEKAEVQYQPKLSDGIHTLFIEARDASGNLAGRSAYRVDFIVRTTPALLNVYNYPNPFPQDTYFTFNLTGSTVPDGLTIKVYTVAGRLIRTIEVPVGTLRFGFNRVYWDGRDNDGNELANGVYFYTMVLKNGEKVDNVTQRLAKVR